MPDRQNNSEGLDSSQSMSNVVHYVIACVYALLAVAAISLNTPVLVAFVKDKTLRTPSNRLILSVAVGDWLHAVLAYPLGVVAHVSRGWQAMTGSVCSWYAFITVFLSFGIMLHHATFAIERAIVINYAITPLVIAKKLNFIITVLWAFSLLWSCFPLFGWSAYVPEGQGALCSIRWQSSESRDTAFVGCIFFFFFLVPIVSMVTAYFKIFSTVKKMTRNARDLWGKSADPTLEALQSERKVARMAFVMSFCFLFAWTPYATVALYSAIGKPGKISPLVATLPALFAKTAPCYNPVIYFLMFKKFRQSLRETMRPLCGRFMEQESSTNIEQNKGELSCENRKSNNESLLRSNPRE